MSAGPYRQKWTEVGGFHRIRFGEYQVLLYWYTGEWMALSPEIHMTSTSTGSLGWREVDEARAWAVQTVAARLLERRERDAEALADAAAMVNVELAGPVLT